MQESTRRYYRLIFSLDIILLDEAYPFQLPSRRTLSMAEIQNLNLTPILNPWLLKDRWSVPV